MSRGVLGFAVLLLVIVLAMVVASVPWSSGPVFGGAGKPRAGFVDHSIVVDTLNLTHWLRGEDRSRPIDMCEIIAAIDETAPVLRKRYPGRVVFVTKDRDSDEPTDEKRAQARALSSALYRTAAERCKVSIYAARRYVPGEEPRGPKQQGSHAEKGRDDFLAAALADELRCGLLTRDRLGDFAELRAAARPFLVDEFSPYRTPVLHQYNPGSSNFQRMRKPWRVDYMDVFGAEPAESSATLVGRAPAAS